MIELNKIYCEDCLQTMARMEDNFIDLTVTSPPYDNLRTYNGYEFNFEAIAKELYRVTKEGGVVVWVVNDATINGSETLTSFKQAIYFREVCGFNLHDTMIYLRGAAFPPTHRYSQDFEYMFIVSKGKPKTFVPLRERKSPNSFGDPRTKTQRQKNGETKLVDEQAKKRLLQAQLDETRRRSNCWYIPSGYMISSPDDIYSHPAIFPEDLAQDHILSWSNEGDLVYDCFMGSGTTAKMCIKTNRNFIGSEISPKYVELANKRIDQHLRQQKLNL